MKNKKGEHKIVREKIEIGSKYKAKPALFYDEPNGIFWEIFPSMDRDALRLQKGLLKKIKDKIWIGIDYATKPDMTAFMVFKYKPDNLPTVKRKFFNGAIGNGVRSFWKWA
jgi:hypothetical protein